MCGCYEPHLALAFHELLDPAKVIAFVPAHHDPKYSAAIEKQNRTFFEYVKDEECLEYDVFDSFEIFQRVESVVSGFRQNFRVNLAPYGPKNFVLSSILAAAVHYPSVFVWHLNSESLTSPPRDRKSSGRVSWPRVLATSEQKPAGGSPSRG